MAYSAKEITRDALGIEVEVGKIYGYTKELESGVILNYKFIVVGFTPSLDSLLYYSVDGYHCHDDSFYNNKREHNYENLSCVYFYSEKHSCHLWPINEEYQLTDPCCIALKNYIKKYN